MKSRADYEKALAIVGAVVRQWDPYSLLSGGAPANEFDAEIANVVSRIQEIRSEEDAAGVLSEIFSKSFEQKGFSSNDCLDVGADLFKALLQNGVLH